MFYINLAAESIYGHQSSVMSAENPAIHTYIHTSSIIIIIIINSSSAANIESEKKNGTEEIYFIYYPLLFGYIIWIYYLDIIILFKLKMVQ